MQAGRRILVADDDPDVRDAVGDYLGLEGYQMLRAADGADAVATMRRSSLDLVLLDLLMPVMDGRIALRTIRAFSAIPIVVLTALGAEREKVDALRDGADDYVTKPFDLRELSARIGSVFRRVRRRPIIPDTMVIDDELTIDFARHRVILHGTGHTLTATEHHLLYLLVSNVGQVVSYETLIVPVWGPEYRTQVQYVRLYVSYLRAKLEQDPAHPTYILTETGVGYRFADFAGPTGEYRRGSVGEVWH